MDPFRVQTGSLTPGETIPECIVELKIVSMVPMVPVVPMVPMAAQVGILVSK